MAQTDFQSLVQTMFEADKVCLPRVIDSKLLANLPTSLTDTPSL